MTWGATLLDVNVPDRNGERTNVNLAFDELEPYLEGHPYFGSTVGRFCNRIEEGKFTIGDKAYQVTTNAGKHHIQAGKIILRTRIGMVKHSVRMMQSVFDSSDKP